MTPRTTPRFWITYCTLAALLLLVFCLSLALGSEPIPLADVLTALSGGEPSRPQYRLIVNALRLPRGLTAVTAGMALAVSGLQMQALFRNPLAGPFVLGINAGASLGAALVLLGTGGAGAAYLGDSGTLHNLGVITAAIAGASMVSMMVLVAARRIRDNVSLLILGLMFGYVAGALVSVFVYFSSAEKIQTFMLWSLGSFTDVTLGQLHLFLPVIGVGLLLALLLMKSLNAMLLGEQYAASMGVSLPRVRTLVILSTALLAGGVTAFCGPIAFLGLAVPHLCRGLLGTADQRALMPSVILLGGILAVVSDIIARLPGSDQALPLNSVTAFVGAPVVVWVIVKRRRLRPLT
jgi:iron complex transport system permease protein